MVTNCEINLFDGLEPEYIPGSVVCGTVKFILTQDIKFNKITVALKSTEQLCLDKVKQANSWFNGDDTFHDDEKYIDLVIAFEDRNGHLFKPNTYDIPFSLNLPNDVEATVDYTNNKDSYSIHFQIFYYVRIKFERPGCMQTTKKFSKIIKVIPDNITLLNSTLPVIPVTYRKTKNLLRLFSKKNNVIELKASVEDSIITAGDRIKLKYEVINDTSTNINGIEIKLVEVIKFYDNGILEEIVDDMRTSKIKTKHIQKGETQTMEVLVDVPPNLKSIQNSKLSVNHFVYVKALVPCRKVVLEIPVTIVNGNTIINGKRQPPPYWEVVNIN